MFFLLVYGLEPKDFEFYKRVKHDGSRRVKINGVITTEKCKKVWVYLNADGKNYRRKKIIGDREDDSILRAQFICTVSFIFKSCFLISDFNHFISLLMPLM